jgi:ribosomal protein S18 acetylase RimI-like enzyme
VADQLVLRPLEQHEWSNAMTLAARSFADEPFIVALFGSDPVDRFARAIEYYQAAPWVETDLALGAFVSDVIVGLCMTSAPGRCRLCSVTDPSRPPEDPRHLADWGFEVNAKQAHSDQGEHGWLRRLVVERALRGAGIGRRMISESLRRLRSEAGTAVLLECQPHRESLYTSLGFRRVREFTDPAGPPAALMRLDLDPSPSTGWAGASEPGAQSR